MGKLDKFKDFLKIGTAVGKVIAPGMAGSVLDAVNKSLNNESDAGNAGAIQALAEDNAEQDEVLILLTNKYVALEQRVKQLESGR
jgi:hypothetical protein